MNESRALSLVTEGKEHKYEEEKSPPMSQSWFINEQKKEDLIEEILFNAQKTNLTHLKRIGWTNGFPDRFRSPSWQLLLHYLPTSKSKREQTLRRKRIEYHRHVSKHYFEFDFCLTDRKLSSVNPSPKPSPSTPGKGANAAEEKLISPNSKRKFSITSKLQKIQSDTLFQASLMPLFSQPNTPGSKGSTTASHQGSSINTTREDSLLLQIRHDINQMVKIPTSSASSRGRRQKQTISRGKSKSKLLSSSPRTTFSTRRKINLVEQQKIKSAVRRLSSSSSADESSSSSSSSTKSRNKKRSAFPSHYDDDIHGESATTTNRLFSNPIVKGSLERILYLWSIRMKNTNGSEKRHHKLQSEEEKYYRSTMTFSNTSSTSRYIPGMVDIVYPLYLTILHGYVWDTHISTTLDNGDSNQNDDSDSDTGGHDNSNSASTSMIGKLMGKSRNKNMIDDTLFHENSFLKRLRLKEEEEDKKEDEEDDGGDKMASLPNNNHRSDVLEDEVRQSKIKFCEELSIGKGIDQIPEEIMEEVEADTFWCLENMMNAIQDFRYNDSFFAKYSTAGTSSSFSSKFKLRNKDGLQKMIILTERVVQRVDPTLYRHLKEKGVEFQWFIFRW
eukprot:CAMPEP_0203685202 /NCGR_PEP_ID=MMETSP0090-20130426/48425_1 /ASSEMBLY_ACC=CAM_ASM_001088 /TAXON_ID=426623 /ORGANISM="Chaetoceros affinis, Strain CCMP159" /LENGTH=613 /DNA_ID=CAMNT_0050554389 /DNA_START=144 /DNA_END=1982 /DNA_ORIENTATION=+